MNCFRFRLASRIPRPIKGVRSGHTNFSGPRTSISADLTIFVPLPTGSRAQRAMVGSNGRKTPENATVVGGSHSVTSSTTRVSNPKISIRP